MTARRDGRADGRSLAELAAVPELRGVLVDHAARGFRVQVVLRALLVAFVVLTVVLVPPGDGRAAAYLVAAGYVLWAALVYLAVRADDVRVLRLNWIALFGDVLALGILTIIASLAHDPGWTGDILLNGLFLVPVLAAVQLRPWVAVTVVSTAFAVFVTDSLLAPHPDVQPWAYVLLRALVLASISVGAVLLVRVQRSRVTAIGRAVVHRNALLRELLETESRERTELSTRLHDGALQYVLAARQELDDLPDDVDPALRDRLREAMSRAGAQLRSQVAELTPVILEQAGLVAAIRRVAEESAARGRFRLVVQADAWPAGATSADRLLFDSAREFLANVATHARARSVTVTLDREGSRARLCVVDDGDGLATGVLEERLEAGHVGLATRRIRLEAAGGTFSVRTRDGGGTVACAEVPVASD